MSEARWRVLIITAFIAVIAAWPADRVAAEMYSYIDKNGTQCYTDEIQSVPEEHRRKAVRIYQREAAAGSQKRADEPSRTESREDGVTAPAIASAAKDPLKYLSGGVAARAAVGLGLFMLVIYATGRIAAASGHKQAGTLIKIGLTVLGMLYVFGSYAGEMAETFDALKEQVMDLKASKEKHDAQVRKTADQSAPVAGK